MAYNFNCVFENEGLIKVTGSHVRCICGIISHKRCKIESLLITKDH